MNALHEPWNEDAISEDVSWGANPALAQADALTDTAASGGGTAAAAGGGGPSGGIPGGLALLGPGQELVLGVTYKGPKVVSA